MFVYMYILEILNVYYTSYSETSEIVLHSGTGTNDTCISEWMCEKNNSVQIHYENKCKWTDASYLLKSSNENSEICKEIYNRKVMARSWLFINK